MPKEKRIKNLYIIASAVLLGIMAIFLIVVAPAQSFSSDEMSTIAYIRDGESVLDIIKGYLVDDVVNLPLYQVILSFFYRVFPYGERWLLLPSLMFTIGGIIFSSLATRKIFGDLEAFLAVCFGTTSTVLMYKCALDIRCYSLLFFSMSLVLFLYMRREEEDTLKNNIFLGIGMLFLFYTHWFGSLMMICFAIMDMLEWLMKKRSIRWLYANLIAGIGFLPYVIALLLFANRLPTTYWGGQPGLKNILEVIHFLNSDRYMWTLLFLLSFIVIIPIYLYQNRKEEKTIGLLKLWISIPWIIGSVYVYSRYINPQGGFFIPKHYISMFPQVLILLSAISAFLFRLYKCSYLKKVMPNIMLKGGQLLITFLMLYFLINNGMQAYRECWEWQHNPREQYRQTAEWLHEEGSIYREDTLVISSETANLTEGWIDYYFKKRGFEPPANIIASSSFRDNDYLDIVESIDDSWVEKYSTIIIYSMSFPNNDKAMKWVDERYTLEEKAVRGGISIYNRNY